MLIIIVPVATQGGKTPAATEHPSRPSPNLGEAINQGLVREAKRDSGKLRELCLRRDGFCSLMSGKLDSIVVENSLIEYDPSEQFSFMRAAHVIPFSLTSTSNRLAEIQHKADVREVIGRFSGEDLLHELTGNEINRLENVLTLNTDEHTYFGKLKCWFEPYGDEPNDNIVRARYALNGIYPKDKVVRFETSSELLPVPDPRYFALHAACAQVVHASGLGEYIDRIIRDVEKMNVLPEDGSSDALVFALHRVSVC